jgi:hypothetical protein
MYKFIIILLIFILIGFTYTINDRVEQFKNTNTVEIKKLNLETICNNINDKIIIKKKTKKSTKKVKPKKVDTKKVDSKKLEPSKVDTKKVEAKKVEPPKVDAKKLEPSKVDTKKVESVEPKKLKNSKTKLSDTYVDNEKSMYVYTDQTKTPSCQEYPPNQVVSLPMVLPQKMLENTKRPNNYNFIYKDQTEVDVRDKNDPPKTRPTKEVFNAYGYSYVPPEFWSVPQNRPPVCIPQKGYEADVLPTNTTGTPINALEVEGSILPKFIYEEVYDPKYYYPGYISK